jgi:SAM-dependent MidA family methyltransferase
MSAMQTASVAGEDRLSAALHARVVKAIADARGWLAFDRFMALALYEPGLGYYAKSDRQFGAMPASGSDFVTAPELSPLFGQVLARQVKEALDASDTDEVFEFGAGSGALAAQLLTALGARVRRYRIVDVSGALRHRQSQRLAVFGDQVQWLDAWPAQMHGVVVGNEVLDAMPVQLLHWDGQAWFERGVAVQDGQFVWADQTTALRPPHAGPFMPGSTVEIHLQAQAFVRSLAERLQRGAAFFIDYGFPEAEYYHPQRQGGTLMCHRAHLADTDPLVNVGDKDITAHVNFSAMALAAQDAGLHVLGYTTQAHALINCGLLDLLQDADLRTRASAQMLIAEHEMGELFKLLGLWAGGKDGITLNAMAFARGDRSHTL